MPPTRDILLTQRFLPENGGSIRWMYEVYRRWPRPVDVITHNYYDYPTRTSEYPHQPPRPVVASGGAGDDVTDANLRMDRRDIFLHQWSLDRVRHVVRYRRMMAAVGERLRRLAPGERLVVHCTHAVPEAVCLLPLKWRYGNRLKIVSYAHGEEISACVSSRQLRFLMNRAHRAVDLMLANSRYTAGLIAPYIDGTKVRVMNPGVDVASFEGAALAGEKWREQRGYRDRLIVATLGRLDPRKNQSAVIEAVAQLAGRYPNLLYVLAGEGRAMNDWRELAKRRGVAERVIFAGSVSNEVKLAIYGGCDLFAMPAVRDGTDVEGFGMVFLEAAACGKPSLAGRDGGQPDAVVEGETGLIVDGNDQNAVTASLERLVSDAALRQRLGENARRHARQCDWSGVVKRTFDLVENIP